jgi:Acylphosphatases
MNKRFHIYYSGSVQGVGFRYMAQSAAQTLGIDGWVKNLEDGRVEVVCEGPEAELNRFLEKIKSLFGAYIRDVRIESQDPTGEFAGFDINF